jgi:hypothetical protein
MRWLVICFTHCILIFKGIREFPTSISNCIPACHFIYVMAGRFDVMNYSSSAYYQQLQFVVICFTHCILIFKGIRESPTSISNCIPACHFIYVMAGRFDVMNYSHITFSFYLLYVVICFQIVSLT